LSSFETFYQWLQRYGLEPHHVFYGTYRARVTAVNDPEKRGRIKVIALEVGNTDTPDIWAYPAFAGAGADRGWFWPPEVGDVVWIAYPRGRLDNPPVYFGGHSAVGKVPAELGYPDGDDTVPTRRGFVTRMGHTFVLNEEAGKEEIDLVWRKPGSAPTDPDSATRDGDEASLKFMPDGSIFTTAKNGSTVQIDTTNKKIVIEDKDNSNTITIDSNGITIKTGAKVVIDGASSFDVKAQAVNLGGDILTEPAVLGQSLLTWLTSHIHPTGVGPSGPPTPPPTPALLSTTVKVK
jgi:uncharacterized protein involved in type VI secretion and phage assembly